MNGTDPSPGQSCFRRLTVLAVIGHEIPGRVAEPRYLNLDRRENTIGRRQVIARIQTLRDELLSTRIPRPFP